MLRTLSVALTVALGLGLQFTASSDAVAARKLVKFDLEFPKGAIVIINSERKLYYVLGNGRAMRYPVAIGKRDEIWSGKQVITQKRKYPSWTHPETKRHVPGGPGNPLGDRALYLGWTLWRIHGTPSTGSIGRAVSNGCIRMYNRDVTDLYERVHIGAPVYVINGRSEATTALNWAKKNIYQRRSKKVASN